MRKKIKLLVSVLFFTLAVYNCSQAANNQSEIIRYSAFHSKETTIEEAIYDEYNSSNASLCLPSSLRIIGNGAFEDTAIVSAKLPKSVIFLGDRAFANTSTVLNIFMPASVKYIGKDIFIGSGQVTLTVFYSGYARKWDRKNGYRFALETTIMINAGINRASSRLEGEKERNSKEKKVKEINQIANIRERWTGRSVGELKADQFKGVASMLIQSRYFP